MDCSPYNTSAICRRYEQSSHVREFLHPNDYFQILEKQGLPQGLISILIASLKMLTTDLLTLALHLDLQASFEQFERLPIEHRLLKLQNKMQVSILNDVLDSEPSLAW